MHSDLIISQSKTWIKEFVIKYNFCPFAKNVFVNEKIRFTVDHSQKLEEHFRHLLLELDVLRKQPAVETSIIIYPERFIDFELYLDFHAEANVFLKNLNCEGVYQLATFHPEFRFADSYDNDPANYTNRSPYPMLHILREDSVTKALETYKNPEEIPEKNVALARELGYEKVKSIRGACFGLN